MHLSRLEQIHVDLTDENINTHSLASSSYLFCVKSVMTLLCGTRVFMKNQSISASHSQKCEKNLSTNAKSSKMTSFSAGSDTAMLTYEKRWSHQMKLRTMHSDSALHFHVSV